MRPPIRLQHIVAATAVAAIAAGVACATASARVVQTIGTTGTQKLRYANDVALGPAGAIYVLDASGREPDRKVLIKVYSPSGMLLRSWRVAADRGGVYDIEADAAGDVYIAVSGNPTILKYSPTGQLLARWQVPPHGNPQLDFVAWIAIDPRGNVVATEGNGRLETFDGQGQLLASGPGVAGPIAVDASGAIYAADARGIVLLDAAGTVARRVAPIRYARSLVAGPAGTLYAVEAHRILKFGTDGRFLGSVGSDRRVEWLHAAVAADGSIYVPQAYPIVGNGAVLKLAPITAVDATPPSVSIDAASTPSRRLLTRLTYTLSEDSSLRVVIKRRAATKDRHNRSFGRYLHKLTLDRAVTSAGTHTLAIDWRAAGYQRHAPGRYQLTLVARDDAGNESRPARVRFSAARR